MSEARENDRAGGRAKAFQVAARVEKGIEQGAIGGEKLAGAFAELFEMVEGHHGEAFGGMRAGGGEQIIEEPHAASKIGSGENPATPQAAQAVDLGETAGNDKRVFVDPGDGAADGKAERRGLVKKHFEIDLVDQHSHARAMS